MVPCYKIYLNYNNNSTISNLLNQVENKNTFLLFSFLLGSTTIIYEIVYRKDLHSSICIFFVLPGIIPVIIINENEILHSIFAFQVFISILYFMTRNCFLFKNYTLLFISLFAEYWLFLSIALNMNKNKNIFYNELFFISNFAFYYIHLHFIS
jgi:hypothetical protein